MASYTGERAKSRTKVKPILRKLTQSEKNSLDLDRPAAEQDGLGIWGDYSNGMASRSSHDVAFIPGRRQYHARSTSGTSQFSTATGGSGQRAGSFVHPFQQTPRPYTPPLVASSYQNSLRESEAAVSPALTEDEDPLRHHNFQVRSPSNLSNHRSPSLTATSSSPVITQPLRIQTKLPSVSPGSRLALSTSHTSLHNQNHSNLLLSHEISSPTADTMSPTSAIRTSIDKGFRLRSRSELDTPRVETIQEARRKFHEKELAKEEKAAREEIKALEKRQQKEAKQIERSHRRSSASDATRSKRSKSDLTMQEKGDGFMGREYGSAFPSTPLPEEYVAPRRSGTAKQKTHSAWTTFVMWLRTRFLRMSSSSKKHSRR